MSDSRVAFEIFGEVLSQVDSDQEHLLVLGVDAQLHAMGCKVVASGSHANVFLSMQRLLRIALLMHASGIMVAHNHPGGSTSMSPDDQAVKQRVREAAQMVGLELHGFYIIGG